ncbi:LLM class flavin-dependent oxidoreductase [Paenibacillus pasadenensis]|uniref:LLM class flavin-dependent oxidoreductase n=1 Tax=Paenibacillus pasadenensis TaxID=217090 RepID=UPI00203F48E3|nr:LLM class flavin-dependent oxidoreductase [Paenibacillus pasadenensis]MCM3747774.1 LLM class flavin-dependent oxidoreductase [Paenibacillus pasadenensis]
MTTSDPSSIRYSILDLAPVTEGSDASESYRRTLELAQLAEELGYYRYWLAEHHNMPGVSSSATSIIISHVASGTSRIRVGSGGIMLPNHAPLAIAEQFGTLESLYPGRIDLGLGRAPGSDQPASRALRRGLTAGGQDFPELLSELRGYFDPSLGTGAPGVRAVPGEGLDIPIWLLGSSGFSAQLAGELGLPFAFASHFAPDYLLPALTLYRSSFKPSAHLDKPHAMVGINIIAADTESEAAWLATSQQQQFLNIIRGRTGKLQPPVDSMDGLLSPQEQAALMNTLRYSIVGTKDTIRQRMQEIQQATGAQEFIIASQIFDHEARLQSCRLTAEALQELA